MKQPDSTTDTNNISNDHTDTMIIVKDVEGQMPKKYFKNILLSHYWEFNVKVWKQKLKFNNICLLSFLQPHLNCVQIITMSVQVKINFKDFYWWH